MKEIRETKMVEQTTVKFVANDGKEFTGEGAEASCRHYEEICNQEECKRLFGLLDAKKFTLPFLGWACDHEAYFIKLASDRDYNIMMNYFESRVGYYASIDINKPKEYPYTMFVIEDDGYIGEHMSVETCKDLMKKFISNYESFYNESF